MVDVFDAYTPQDSPGTGEASETKTAERESIQIKSIET
jgi:hypothetical protein